LTLIDSTNLNENKVTSLLWWPGRFI